MARWIKVLAVVLAVVVSVTPVFGRIYEVQAISNPFLLPYGEELSNQQLLNIDGKMIDLGDLLWWDLLVFGFSFAGSMAGGASFHQAYWTAYTNVCLFNLGVLYNELNKPWPW